MKKIISSVLVILMMLSLSATSFASSSTTYLLEDTGISIDIPSEDFVVTREDLATGTTDNPLLIHMSESDRKASYERWKSDNEYLFATIGVDGIYLSLSVYIKDSEGDLRTVNDTRLTNYAASCASDYEGKGLSVEKYEIYHHDQAKFIKFFLHNSTYFETDYYLNYIARVNNKYILVTMKSPSQKIDADREALLHSIMETVHFDGVPMLRESYKDYDTGIEIILPVDWTQKPLSKKRQFIDAKFTSSKQIGLTIYYGSTDMWSQMSFAEKNGRTRSDIDNAYFTLDEIAEMNGIPKDIVSTATYGGKEYYQYVNRSTSSAYGMDFSVTTTCIFRIDNGYVYTFQFFGDSDNEYYGDFELLLDSVKYP